MKKTLLCVICIAIYSTVITLTSYNAGRKSNLNAPTNATNAAVVEEEPYTAMEKNGKLALYKDGRLLMSLDTNVELLPTIVRAQLKKGVDFKPSELPRIIEAFAE